jgi:predicted  nucleic acid-binding Zn-ribbon protein
LKEGIAVAGPATVLREIHRLRRHAKDLQSEMERVPRQLKVQQAKITRQEEAVREIQELLKKLKLQRLDRESQLKTTWQQIAKHEKQLNEAGSKKEYDALKVEIASDKKRCEGLENEILEAEMEIEEKTAQVPVLEQAVKQAKQEYAEAEKNARARQVSLGEQRDAVGQTIQQVEATLPNDVRPHYDRLIAARGEDALTTVENRTCMACYTEITAQAYNDLMLSQFVLCKSCGRALYLPE